MQSASGVPNGPANMLDLRLRCCGIHRDPSDIVVIRIRVTDTVNQLKYLIETLAHRSLKNIDDRGFLV